MMMMIVMMAIMGVMCAHCLYHVVHDDDCRCRRRPTTSVEQYPAKPARGGRSMRSDAPVLSARDHCVDFFSAINYDSLSPPHICRGPAIV